MGFLSRHHSGQRPRLALGGNLLVLLELWRGSSRVPTGTPGTRLWGLREVPSTRLRRGPSGFLCNHCRGPRSSSGLEVGASGFL